MKEHELENNTFPLEARKLLNKIDKSINQNHTGAVNTIPSIMIVGDNIKMNEDFSKWYEKILLKNDVYPIHGNKTYLSLVFPKNGSEKDYRRLYLSPQIVSCVQNKFYGILEISFEEFDGKDLLNSEEFSRLLSYIDENKETIIFVFSVTSKFKETNALKELLSNHLLIESLRLEIINPENATLYVKTVLKNNGLVFRPEASLELKNIIDTKLNVNSPEFNGYSSLDIIANNLMYELKPKISQQSGRVTKDMMEEAGRKIYMPTHVDSKRKIGF